MSPPSNPFLFPETKSKVQPDPYRFFSPELLSSPLPTNSFFQNFVLKSGNQPEYIHPYLIRFSLSRVSDPNLVSSIFSNLWVAHALITGNPGGVCFRSSISLSYPSRSANSSVIYQVFQPDFTITPMINHDPGTRNSHVISSFNDLSVTVNFPSLALWLFLVRGSPFVTCELRRALCLSISTVHSVISVSSNSSQTKCIVKLSNNQTWVIYSQSPVNFRQDGSVIISDTFSGIIRVAVLPDSGPKCGEILDRFSSCYPVSGEAVFTEPFCLGYRFETKGQGDLLMLAHPLHLKLLEADDLNKVTILDDLKYKSIDGELVGIVGNRWSLRTKPISITWHSIRGVRVESHAEIISALLRDVMALNSKSISTTCSYFYGKVITRAARLALIAEEVCCLEAIPTICKFLKDSIKPWLDGTFGKNGFLYDRKWGGLVTKQGSENSQANFGFGLFNSPANFGFGLFNDHHYHLGYFLYAIAVLVKFDPDWGRKYKPQAYAIMSDFMNLGKQQNPNYTRLRCFDLYKLHSWAGGLIEFTDGRNQESTSEAVNAYYSAALMGLAFRDTNLVALSSTLAAMEIQAAQTWWQVRRGSEMYEDEFSKNNKVVGVLWSNKRDSGLWFGPAEWKECRLGIQVLPITPVTELLFSDVGYVRELVNWAMPALKRKDVGEGWKGFVYALEAMYGRDSALEKVRNLKGFDDGDSLTNLLWWIHSRG